MEMCSTKIKLRRYSYFKICTSLNSITCSRFIGYNLSFSRHPFISACETTKNKMIFLEIPKNKIENNDPENQQ